MPAPDLVALVIELAALMPTHIDNHMGRAVQKAALDLIVTHQPDLAQSLHDREDLKPFTVSGLMRDDVLLFGDVAVGCPVWIRVTGQSAEVAHHVLISRYNLRTMLVRGKNGGKEIGFVGEVVYELSRTSDYLEKGSLELEALLRAEGKWFARTLALLVDFAFYSGIGRKTTTGMGMARGS